MRLPRLARLPALLAAGLLELACSSRPKEKASEAPRPGGGAQRPAAPSLDRPLEALRASADEVAARAGSFEWEARVTWSVARPGVAPLRASERHEVRQLASGDFEVTMDLDPGTGPGSETGKRIVFSKGMTYARGRWAPFRERPADRGEEARRHRDESFHLAADLADLYGPALSAEPAGGASFLGRRARKYVFSLSSALPRETPPPPPPGLPDAGYDADTRRRVDFVQGRVPVALAGELLLDAETALPLYVAMKGAFSQKSDPQLRADVELTAEVKALGALVGAVTPPRSVLPDERKPKGVARALEAAGLRKRAGATEPAEDEDEGDPAQGE
jgi:hypothetical protein